MKKSNSLMFSYILFLAITLISYFFFKWDGLDRIAMAATIAGCVFAFADLMGWIESYTSNYWESVQNTNNFVTSIYEAEIDTAEEQNEQIEEVLETIAPYAHKNKHLSAIQANIIIFSENNRKRIEEYQASLIEDAKLQNEIEKSIDRCKLWHMLEFAFMVTGFVLFFMVIVFNNIVGIITQHQTIVTIIAFLLIMLNYFLKECIEEHTKKELDKLLKKAENCKSNLAKNKEDFDNLQLLDCVHKYIETHQENNALSEDASNG